MVGASAVQEGSVLLTHSTAAAAWAGPVRVVAMATTVVMTSARFIFTSEGGKGTKPSYPPARTGNILPRSSASRLLRPAFPSGLIGFPFQKKEQS